MFCPRCGRPVSETANFCGGCGLPRTEIEKSIREKARQMQTPVVPAAPAIDRAETEDIHSTIEKLENDLTGISPVIDYTTEQVKDTNNTDTTSDFAGMELKKEQSDTSSEQKYYSVQSDYSANAPKHPGYTQGTYLNYTQPQTEPAQKAEDDITLTTVDYIWMMLISSIPVVGLIYLIWLGFVQKDNPNKTAFARAVIIISVFAFILSLVFIMGLIITQLGMFY